MAAWGITAKLCFPLQGVLPHLWLPSPNKHLLLFTDQTLMAILSVSLYSFIAWLLVWFRFKWPEWCLYIFKRGPRTRLLEEWFNNQDNSILDGFQRSISGWSALFHWLVTYWRCWLSDSVGLKARWCHLNNLSERPFMLEWKSRTAVRWLFSRPALHISYHLKIKPRSQTAPEKKYNTKYYLTRLYQHVVFVTFWNVHCVQLSAPISVYGLRLV